MAVVGRKERRRGVSEDRLVRVIGMRIRWKIRNISKLKFLLFPWSLQAPCVQIAIRTSKVSLVQWIGGSSISELLEWPGIALVWVRSHSEQSLSYYVQVVSPKGRSWFQLPQFLAYSSDNMIRFQYHVKKKYGMNPIYIILIRIDTEERGVLVWTIHIPPPWRG